MWTKKLHVESSLQRKEGQFSLFIGRWQPLHDGHKQLFQQVLDEGGNVLIGIRKGVVDEKNPYTAEQVKENIEKTYSLEISENRVNVIILKLILLVCN